MYKLMNGDLQWKRWMSFLLLALGTVWGLLFTGLQFVDRYKETIIASGIIKDPFAVENLKAEVHWSGWEFLVGAFFLSGVLFAVYLITRGNMKGIIILFACTLITTNLAVLVFAPRIEQYTQGAAIEFYRSKSDELCRVETIHFKSYAQYFYKRTTSSTGYFQGWDTSGKKGEPFYFVSKIQDAEKVKSINPSWEELYRKNGFVFWERK